MRLIDVEPFDFLAFDDVGSFADGVEWLLEKIDNAPIISPVKHGHWIYYGDETIEDGGHCSVCQCDQPAFWKDRAWNYVETDYCPNCGAKMDEVSE